jgi:hypothetical protein
MVAYELAQVFEKTGSHPEAIRWYTTAAERFRRPQWKQKAEEGLARLGAPIPAPAAVTETAAVGEASAQPAALPEPIIAEFSDEQPAEMSKEMPDEMNDGQHESVFEPSATVAPTVSSPAQHSRGRRRGRRGGRGRRKGPRAATPALAESRGALPVPPSMFDRVAQGDTLRAERPGAAVEFAKSGVLEPEPPRGVEPAASSVTAARGRSGDPALSSRMAQLESQLRRLLACSLHSLDHAEEAPAGPGVFLVTDADQTTYYYAEACQTLRVGVGNLLRSGRGSREGSNLKEKLAEHLGISEARVGKYLKDHCRVRWLQLDEGAPLLAHFAVAVLRPAANE